MAVVWLVLGVVLLLVEMRHLAFYALFVAIGSFAAAVVALVLPSAVAVQMAAAVAVAAAGVLAVRPAISRAFPRHVGGHVARGVHGGLIGQQALTLDEVGPEHRRGHVRLTGERWLAVSGAGESIAADTPVVVTGVEGTTLTVWPLEGRPLGGPAAHEIESGRPDEARPDSADGRAT